MKLFRYRKPSLNTILGITKAKRQAKKALGIYNVTKILNAPQNFKRRILRKTGYYSEPMKMLRNGAPKPGGGCVIAFLFIVSPFVLAYYIF